ncbi:hypothetical protein [Leekyejoonella antrihumi]|uniref:Uncharacterized protein n=1 Tax=Leekyejoonella antrihumi TaxID=1660198 RepID=A0A563DTN2_9MICO|nr:hypothetical protein [Leekyejoonella antrihumi]TWP33539.1 hypothetical protein FGL98_21060 [Leekyejoonella antrihumi]
MTAFEGSNLIPSTPGKDTVVGLRAWASGILPTEAGVELLISAVDGRLLHGPWIRIATDDTCTCFDATLADAAGELSGGERRILRIAASLADPTCMVALADVLVGLDDRHARLVLNAVAHAAGWSGAVATS